MSYKLFIADDSKVLCKLLAEKLLEFDKLEIAGIAHNFSDAIKIFESTNPDVAILDIQMPGGNGIEILNHIKKKKQASTKVIIFTNYPYPQYRKKCEEAGADYFFDKHTEFKELFDVIKKFVEGHPDPKLLRPENQKRVKTENKRHHKIKDD